MARAEANWERLVRAALRGERLVGAYGQPVTGIAGNVPSSLGNNVHIEEVLRAADEIQDEDPTVARILCEHAYALAQNLDPNSEGRGVLQFKTGLMSVIRQKLAKREGGAIDRSQDIAKLQEFYKLYREKHKVDELIEDEMKLRESAVFSGNLGELERKTLKRKKVLATLKVLWSVIEDMTKEISPEDAKNLISEEMKKVMQKDAARTEDVVAYNIIPLDALSPTTNAIVTFPEVRAAISALQYHRDLPRLPGTFSVPDTRNSDMLDLLQCVFGFQEGNVKNQREHIVHLLANEQSRLGKLSGNEPKIDEGAVHVVFSKSLDNYIKWCNYLPIRPVWINTDSLTKEKKLLYVCLYYLMWGEAANVRFLPEGLCYIFHHLARELEEVLRKQTAEPAESCNSNDGVSFLDRVVSPLYEIIAAEAANNKDGRAPHSAWRNYDDFNEFFWSVKCFQLNWPWNLSNPFFSKPSRKEKGLLGGSHHYGKTSFVEHRTFLHLYHSFHRLWMFLIMMFQGLTIVAFNNESFDKKTGLQLLSLGPTHVVLKFVESLLDILMMYGAYSTSRGSAITRVLWRFCWFTVASLAICYLYVKALQDGTQSATFKIYVFVISAYFGAQIIISLLMSVPCCHGLTEACHRWSVVRLAKWMHQEQNYVGRGMHESPLDYIKYVAFWIVILGAKFSFTYFLQIKPLVKPTRTIISFRGLQYAWHDFVSKNNHNALTILSLWAPVVSIYLLDIHVFYTVLSAIYGFLLGARDRLGEIRSVEAVHRFFEKFPEAFMDKLHVAVPKRKQLLSSGQDTELNKFDASRFASFWNEIVRNLREEDYINNAELELLFMPKNDGVLPLVQWPLFLLASKVFLAKDIAIDCKDSQDELWLRISKDEYMQYAVVECFHSIYYVLTSILDKEGRLWVERIYGGIRESISKKTIQSDLHFMRLPNVIAKLVAVLGILRGTTESGDLKRGAVNAIQDLYEVVHHEVLSVDMSGNIDDWAQINRARAEGRLFNNLKWPNDPGLKDLIKRLYSLLTIKESAANVPKNLEAGRRLEFFTNSLFMQMPVARPVSEMFSFSVFTPYYSEIVLYSMAELQKKNEDGIIGTRDPCQRQQRQRDAPPVPSRLLRRGRAAMSLSHRLPPAAPAGDPYYLYVPPPPQQHPDPQRQGVLTLFVAGLPDDVKPREIHNLFSHRPGFDHCLLEYTGRGNQAVAFVSFFTHQAALSAMAALNGTIFDPETGDRLHIELAKSTSRRPRGGGDVYRVIDKRVNKIEGDTDHEAMGDNGDDETWGEDEDGDNGDEGSDEPSGTENENSSNKNELPADQSGQPEHKQQKGQSTSNDEPDKSSGDIPPCSTLFIANLGHACTEEELTEVLSKQPGFHVLKMRRRGGMPVAFADFMDIESSTAAMNNLKGTILSSSDIEGLHIEYARSKMRKS